MGSLQPGLRIRTIHYVGNDPRKSTFHSAEKPGPRQAGLHILASQKTAWEDKMSHHDTADCKDALCKIHYGVHVVTLGLGGVENGLTVSWLTQVSHEPPMLAFSIARTHYSRELLDDNPVFVVNILKDDQADVASHFAKASVEGEDKIARFPTRPADNEVPILTDSLAYLECEVDQQVEVGNHLLVIARVTGGQVLNEGEPLTTDSGMRYRK
jgi:flavin reductase (DIM6/NTAB) family NADH-FMN oxidoreductase RutF